MAWLQVFGSAAAMGSDGWECGMKQEAGRSRMGRSTPGWWKSMAAKEVLLCPEWNISKGLLLMRIWGWRAENGKADPWERLAKVRRRDPGWG